VQVYVGEMGLVEIFCLTAQTINFTLSEKLVHQLMVICTEGESMLYCKCSLLGFGYG